MDFNKPVYAEIDGGEDAANKFREYLVNHDIAFNEAFEYGVYIFECDMTENEMLDANLETDALFYQ